MKKLVEEELKMIRNRNSIRYRIKRFINETVFIVPITLLIVSFISAFINYKAIRNGYMLLGNISGYSLIVDYAFLGFYSFSRRFCYFTRLSPVGLIVINTIDIIACFLDEKFYQQYNFWYTIITCAIIFILVIFLKIRKYLNK